MITMIKEVKTEHPDIGTECPILINGREALFIMHALMCLMTTVTDKDGCIMYISQEIINRLMDFNAENYDIKNFRDDSVKNPTTLMWDDLLDCVNASLNDFILRSTVNKLTEDSTT